MADTTTPGAMPAASCEPFADTHFDATPPEGVAIPFTRDEVSELVQALQRRALAGELPTAKPPADYAPLRDVAGPAGKRAQVVAYFIREGLQWDHIGPDGEIRTPRDPGYLAALQARLTRSAPPKGWKLRRRRALASSADRFRVVFIAGFLFVVGMPGTGGRAGEQCPAAGMGGVQSAQQAGGDGVQQVGAHGFRLRCAASAT